MLDFENNLFIADREVKNIQFIESNVKYVFLTGSTTATLSMLNGDLIIVLLEDLRKVNIGKIQLLSNIPSKYVCTTNGIYEFYHALNFFNSTFNDNYTVNIDPISPVLRIINLYHNSSKIQIRYLHKLNYDVVFITTNDELFHFTITSRHDDPIKIVRIANDVNLATIESRVDINHLFFTYNHTPSVLHSFQLPTIFEKRTFNMFLSNTDIYINKNLQSYLLDSDIIKFSRNTSTFYNHLFTLTINGTLYQIHEDNNKPPYPLIDQVRDFTYGYNDLYVLSYQVPTSI